MNFTIFFGLLGGLLVLAFLANRLSKWTRVPDVIVLLATGIVVGPVLHWINPARLGDVARGFGTLALILILFAAGLELDLRNAFRQFSAGLVLAFASYGLTFAGIAYFCIYALHLAKMPSLLVASTLACMSASIVLPVLEQLEMRSAVKTTLIIETSFGDGLGALGVSVLLDLLAGGSALTKGPLAAGLARIGLTPGTRGSIVGGVTALVIFKFLLALAVAIVAGYAWTRLLPLVSDKQFWQVLTFGAVLLLYAGARALGASELLAVMAFGGTLANLPGSGSTVNEFGFRILPPDPSKQIHSFHSELAFLVRSFFFVLLGALVEFEGLRRQVLPTLGVAAVLFLARFLAVELSRIAWRGTTRVEREVAMLLIPRGLITAVLALEVVQAMPMELSFLTPLAFGVILLTNAFVLLAAIRAHRLRADAPVSATVVAPSLAPRPAEPVAR
jgi:cell volume regulation protein A